MSPIQNNLEQSKQLERAQFFETYKVKMSIRNERSINDLVSLATMSDTSADEGSSRNIPTVKIERHPLAGIIPKSSRETLLPGTNHELVDLVSETGRGLDHRQAQSPQGSLQDGEIPQTSSSFFQPAIPTTPEASAEDEGMPKKMAIWNSEHRDLGPKPGKESFLRNMAASLKSKSSRMKKAL